MLSTASLLPVAAVKPTPLALCQVAPETINLISLVCGTCCFLFHRPECIRRSPLLSNFEHQPPCPLVLQARLRPDWLVPILDGRFGSKHAGSLWSGCQFQQLWQASAEVGNADQGRGKTRFKL